MVFLHSKAAHAEWEPYENSGLSGNFVRLRHNVLPILLTKRRFFLPRVNLVGLSLIELAVAMALSSALGGMGSCSATTSGPPAHSHRFHGCRCLLWSPSAQA
jgi:hypothetical protein